MNKTVLITGASRGIGAEAARIFAQNDYNVVVNYHASEQKAIELCRSLLANGYSATPIKADVSNRAEVDRMIDTVNDKFGKIDVLINNAGVAKQSLFTDISQAEWDRMVAVNLTGTFNCCQAVLPDMISRHEGSIINVSSIWGICGASCEVHYSATKAAIIGLTKALAKEVGPSNIRVNCVAPGVIETDMNSNLSLEDLQALMEETPLGRVGTTNDIAELLLFLSSDKASFITGQIISPNGGFVI